MAEERQTPLHGKGFWIAGIHPVREALRSRGASAVELLVARQDPRIQECLDLAESQGIPVLRVDRHQIHQKTGHEHHQGIALQVTSFPYASLETLLGAGEGLGTLFLILDNIQDPQNLGALIRSAAFFGAAGVILPRDRSAGVTTTVVQVSAGGASVLPIAQVTNLARALIRMKESGFWIVGLDSAGEKSLYEVDLTVPVGLVVGNEEKGIRPLVKKLCDFCVRIPGAARIDSLNAAAAGAIAMAELERQRRFNRP
ncbi:MAG: 23S rRNA (guanosine(2251)-2'-O)-methyltransferase RlmB [Syntrophobacteraceae bacterium]|nr:23S rRNA (guanosine(2251)-2'-O)-methyltransferase RlmB [Syntrophobacteraceae bacterium]